MGPHARTNRQRKRQQWVFDWREHLLVLTPEQIVNVSDNGNTVMTAEKTLSSRPNKSST